MLLRDCAWHAFRGAAVSSYTVLSRMEDTRTFSNVTGSYLAIYLEPGSSECCISYFNVL